MWSFWINHCLFQSSLKFFKGHTMIFCSCFRLKLSKKHSLICHIIELYIVGMDSNQRIYILQSVFREKILVFYFVQENISRIEIWDSCCDLCNSVCMQKTAAQQDAWHNVLCGAARRGGQGQFKAASEFFLSFCTKFFPRSLTWGKNPEYPGKKIGTEPGKNSVAGAGPLGRSWLERAGQRWRTGQGWGQEPGRAGGGAGGRACSYINTTGVGIG